MEFEESYNDFRNKPLKKGKMSVRKFRKRLRKAPGIWEVGEVIEKFLTQFSKLDLRWLYSDIKHKLDKKYNIGASL